MKTGHRLAALAALTLACAAVVVPNHALPSQAATSPPGGHATTARQAISEPIMGWNDWNAFGCNVSAQLVEQTADKLASSGLRDAGYRYVDIDDCWAQKARDADGRLVPDPTRFPDGIKAVADYVHARGMKLGIYADAGTTTCAGYPGSLGHEATDAQTFADWGVDLLKYDNCHNDGSPAQQRYQAMSDALAGTGHKIVFSICEWGLNKPWEWAPGMGDTWRIDGDITDAWTSVRSIVRQLMRVGNGWAGPGFPDADMLQIGNGGLSVTEARTHMGMWAMYGSPLIMGNDVRSMDADTLALLGNRDVIAVDQQAGGHPVRQVSPGHGDYVLARGMNDGSTVVALYNETDTPTHIGTTAKAAGLPSAAGYDVRDLWTGETATSSGTLSDQVPARGVTLLNVRPKRSGHGVTPVVSYDAPRGAGAEEYLAGSKGLPTTVSLTAPKGAGALHDVAVKLAVPSGWTASGPTARSAGTVREGDTARWTWRLTPTGTGDGTATAVVSWTDSAGHAVSRAVSLRLVPTPVAPQGNTSVAALPWLHAWSGYADPQRNTGIEGQKLSVNGTTFATGVGSHAESGVAVWLGGRCSRLTTSVGLQDGTNAGGSVQGEVLGDGKRLASSDVMTAGMDAQPLSVDVSGVAYLELHTKNGGNSTYGDRIAWGDTGLTCQ